MIKDTQKLFNAPEKFQSPAQSEFDALRISIASPEIIRSWSYGEVKKTETINYRTFKPERDGLFCAKIFGPVKDYECLCGKYRRMKYKGITCEKCGVEVTLSRVRRERMGHIELAAPVAHIWILKSLPSRIGMLLNMQLKEVESILYFEKYVVIDSGLTTLKTKSLMTEEEYQAAIEEYGEDSFKANMGAEAIQDLLKALDLEVMRQELYEELEKSQERKRGDVIKRLRLVKALIRSKTHPEWMVMTVLPVIPPDLRPLVPLDGGRFATSDLNDLYRRVINRNNRLKRLQNLGAPDIIIRNEKRMLQEAVDALFDNSRRSRPLLDSNNRRPLKSLSDMLKGKQGRFRQNLLGKRVDYSGRSVIVVGPELELNQCGLPKKMALELFRPFIYAKLELYGHAPTIKIAKRLVEKERPEVWNILEEVTKEHPVLLNRAPTLHRLGIQAFDPVLVEGKAIRLHPLVCTAFNADFDGDQMAVHVPLSLEAQFEAKMLMMASHNILRPADGRPIIGPSQDIVLGIYHITTMREGLPNEFSEKKMKQGDFTGIYGSEDEILLALDRQIITYQTKILARMAEMRQDGTVVYEKHVTTPGRVILATIVPKSHKLPFRDINKQMTSKDLGNLISLLSHRFGRQETVSFANKMVTLGFSMACKTGVSFGKDDMIVPPEKESLIARTKKLIQDFEDQYDSGLITQGEKYNKIVDAWAKCSDEVAQAMIKAMSQIKDGKPINSVYMMAHSGSRGSPAQMKQLAGMRGLMAKPSGEIIETPIISNFKEGLTMSEYFNSTHGARKGLADTALKTANSGYLTRRLVDVAQDSVIHEEDCGTHDGRTVSAVVDGENTIVSLEDQILGRVCAEDILVPGTKKVLIKRNTLLEESLVEKIRSAAVEQVVIRSPLTCEAKIGICAACYGRDLAHNAPVQIGEAVGIVAAQSIGEPGTQLTMRTFHIGGAAATGGREQAYIDSPSDAMVDLSRAACAQTKGAQIVVSRNAEIILLDISGRQRARFSLPYGAVLKVKEGDKVIRGQRLAEWDPHMMPIVAEISGRLKFVNLEDGKTLQHRLNPTTGSIISVVISHTLDVSKTKKSKSNDLRPGLAITDKSGETIMQEDGRPAIYTLPLQAVLNFKDGEEVKAGDTLARLPRQSRKNTDITGGLPRVAELFEARLPKEPEFRAEVSGRVQFGKVYKNRRVISIVAEDETISPVSMSLPTDRHMNVRDGDYLEKGDIILEGQPVPQDILRLRGIKALADYLIEEIQSVYRLQGVVINDKHIEVIVRQMLQKVRITESGDSDILVDELVDSRKIQELNKALEAEGKKPAQFVYVLQGITKASLNTDSFISAASFQETIRVLTEAAFEGKTDHLRGLKENVIVGQLIPAGTGRSLRRLQEVAYRKYVLEAAAKPADTAEAVPAEQKAV